MWSTSAYSILFDLKCVLLTQIDTIALMAIKIQIILILALMAAIKGQEDQLGRHYYESEAPAHEQVHYQTPTSLKQAEQQQKMMEFIQANPQMPGMTSFAFELDATTQQFEISIPSDNEIFFQFRCYVMKENAYQPVFDIENESPVLLTVLQNHQVMDKKEFYFHSISKIQGKKDSHYRLAMSSQTPKLVIARYNKVFQKAHLDEKVKNDKMVQYSNKIEGILSSLNNLFQSFRITNFIEFQQRRLLNTKFDKYSYFQVFQMILVLLLSACQVQLVTRLFKSSSIV